MSLASQQQPGELLVKLINFKSRVERAVAIRSGDSNRIDGCAVIKNVYFKHSTNTKGYTCIECLPDWVLSSEGKCYYPVVGTDYETQTNAKNCLFSTGDTCEACPAGMLRLGKFDNSSFNDISDSIVLAYLNSLAVNCAISGTKRVCVPRPNLEQLVSADGLTTGIMTQYQHLPVFRLVKHNNSDRSCRLFSNGICKLCVNTAEFPVQDETFKQPGCFTETACEASYPNVEYEFNTTLKQCMLT